MQKEKEYLVYMVKTIRSLAILADSLRMNSR